MKKFALPAALSLFAVTILAIIGVVVDLAGSGNGMIWSIVVIIAILIFGVIGLLIYTKRKARQGGEPEQNADAKKNWDIGLLGWVFAALIVVAPYMLARFVNLPYLVSAVVLFVLAFVFGKANKAREKGNMFAPMADAAFLVSIGALLLPAYHLGSFNGYPGRLVELPSKYLSSPYKPVGGPSLSSDEGNLYWVKIDQVVNADLVQDMVFSTEGMLSLCKKQAGCVSHIDAGGKGDAATFLKLPLVAQAPDGRLFPVMATLSGGECEIADGRKRCGSVYEDGKLTNPALWELSANDGTASGQFKIEFASDDSILIHLYKGMAHTTSTERHHWITIRLFRKVGSEKKGIN